jgi:uncharacterized membrane protein YgaE (UPF0421/DUF939 family)
MDIKNLKKLNLQNPAIQQRLINSFKTIVACSIGIVIGLLTHLSMPQWILIAILVVMVTNFRLGGALKKSYLRIAGTAIGAIVASLLLFFLGTNLVYIYIALLILIGLFAYLGTSPTDISQLGLLGAVTSVIILYAQPPSFHVAAERSIENIIGIVIALGVTRWLFPIRSSKVLITSIQTTLNDLSALLEIFTDPAHDLNNFTPQEQFEAQIIKNLTEQNVLIKEVTAEGKSHKKALLYTEVLQEERKLFRSLYMLKQILLQLSESHRIETLNNLYFKTLIDSTVKSLGHLSKFIVTPGLSPLSSLASFNKNLEIAVEHFETDDLFHQPMYRYTFVFCIQHLIHVTYHLNRLFEKLVDQGIES